LTLEVILHLFNVAGTEVKGGLLISVWEMKQVVSVWYVTTGC